MTHETELVDVPEQHSIDKVLFGDSIDVCRQCQIVCALTEVITGVFRLGRRRCRTWLWLYLGKKNRVLCLERLVHECRHFELDTLSYRQQFVHYIHCDRSGAQADHKTWKTEHAKVSVRAGDDRSCAEWRAAEHAVAVVNPFTADPLKALHFAILV